MINLYMKGRYFLFWENVSCSFSFFEKNLEILKFIMLFCIVCNLKNKNYWTQKLWLFTQTLSYTIPYQNNVVFIIPFSKGSRPLVRQWNRKSFLFQMGFSIDIIFNSLILNGFEYILKILGFIRCQISL